MNGAIYRLGDVHHWQRLTIDASYSTVPNGNYVLPATRSHVSVSQGWNTGCIFHAYDGYISSMSSVVP